MRKIKPIFHSILRHLTKPLNSYLFLQVRHYFGILNDPDAMIIAKGYLICLLKVNHLQFAQDLIKIHHP